MRTLASPLRLLPAALAVLAFSAGPALAQAPVQPDPARDPRLARRVLLRSEGVPLSHVLKRLSDKTDVLLTVSGTPGDERLVAFAPDTSLADAMRSIADLYGLRWLRSTSEGKPSYQLVRTLERVRQEADLKRAAIQQSLVELDRVAKEPVRPNPRDPERHSEALRAAAIASLRANWERLTTEGHLEVPFGMLPKELQDTLSRHGRPAMARAQQELVESDRLLRERLLQEGKPLPNDLKEEPQPRPLLPLDEWQLVYEVRVNQGLEVSVSLRPSSFRTTLFLGRVNTADATGISLYQEHQPRPTLAPGNGANAAAGDPPFPANDPLGQRLAVLNSSQLQPSHLSTPWLTAMENLAEIAGLALYSDDYSNPDAGGKQRQAATLTNGISAGEYLDQLCRNRAEAPPSFWWRRGSNVMIRSRNFLYEADSVLPARLIDGLLARARTKENLLLPNDLVELSRLTMAQLQGLVRWGEPLQAWKQAVQLPARLSPVAQGLVVSTGLTWETMPAADRPLARQLAPAFGVGNRYRARLEATASHPSWRSRSQIHLRLETELTPGSAYGFSLPAGQANPQGLLVMDPNRARSASPVKERLVFALYYPWYGLKAVSGEDRKQKIVTGKIENFAHQPAEGPYDSTEEIVLKRHLAQLKAAGVDVLTCYWPGPNTFEDRAVRKLMPLAKAEGLRVCFLLDDLQPTATFAAQMATWLKALDEGYLKVDGKPVIFVGYTLMNRLSLQGWADLFESLEKAAPPGVVCVAPAWTSVEMTVFSGINLNSGLSWGQGEGPTSIARRAREISLTRSVGVQGKGRIAVAQVQPGFSINHLQPDHSPIDRADGAFYRALWNSALDAGADWILIDSFNHWEIGSEIEPSREFGDTYLKITAEFASRFKSRPAPGN